MNRLNSEMTEKNMDRADVEYTDNLDDISTNSLNELEYESYMEKKEQSGHSTSSRLRIILYKPTTPRGTTCCICDTPSSSLLVLCCVTTLFLLEALCTGIPLAGSTLNHSVKHVGGSFWYDHLFVLASVSMTEASREPFALMECEVIHGVLNNGSIYLDGLRKAMAHYREKLYNCTTVTTTSPPSTWLPENDPKVQTHVDPCTRIMEASDQVTKLSELALWATNELRDRKFAENKDNAAQEEEELLMKLAWFLDQLAHLTGYEPDPTDFENTFTTESTTTNTEYTTPNPETTGPLEIMQSVENGPPLSKLPPKSARQKRSTDDATSHFVKNYIKYKIWDSDNSYSVIPSGQYDVGNDLNTKSVQKRAAVTKKAIRLRAPTKRQRAKAKKIIIEKPKYYFQKHKNGGLAVKIVRKPIRDRRSVYYEDYAISRIPENPMQDISYYIKSRPGTLYSPSQIQVENVNESLRRHYNIQTFEYIKQFGSNATLGMNNLLLGAMKSSSDAQ
ncbi:unnamed protein product [Leptosia nina]|uniref:Uncharacterized protein n=1 Tax=Leptosia nina TaxID=320188 RepID=A0AAV1K2Z3_9NEOP